MPANTSKPNWGQTPWTIDFHPKVGPIPQEVDFAIVGGGFTGLSAAAWLRRLEPSKSIAVFESMHIGAGSSGHTGGLTLAETAAGDLPGLGDVLAGFSDIRTKFALECDLTLPGVWELSHNATLPDSPISWTDPGALGASRLVPGGTVDPGKLVSELARVAEESGAQIFENAAVENIEFGQPLRLEVRGTVVRTRNVLLATNAMSLELTDLGQKAQPKFTLAVATKPLTPEQIADLGLDSGKPFYTVDLPYLWGRLLSKGRILFGCGLVHLNDWRELAEIDVVTGEAAELIARLERRIHGLHPVLRDAEFTHRWGGPILIAEKWRPVFARHPRSLRALVLGAYSGHGVTLSVYLGRWAAEAMLGRRNLPDWASV